MRVSFLGVRMRKRTSKRSCFHIDCRRDTPLKRLKATDATVVDIDDGQNSHHAKKYASPKRKQSDTIEDSWNDTHVFRAPQRHVVH